MTTEEFMASKTASQEPTQRSMVTLRFKLVQCYACFGDATGGRVKRVCPSCQDSVDTVIENRFGPALFRRVLTTVEDQEGNIIERYIQMATMRIPLGV